jgi:MFS family permease
MNSVSSSRGHGWRLFLTCWVVYSLHLATDFSREHYLVKSIVDDHSFAMDPYYGLHRDIFVNPPEAKVQGAHHGANPGISMLAALPYFAVKPVTDAIDQRIRAGRPPADTVATYDDPRGRRVAFYQEVYRRGWDIRFGLITIVTQVLFNAPLAAAGAVVMRALLGWMGLAPGPALGFALLYAFGTPAFFRAGYLSQNLGIAVFALAAFALLWDPGRRVRLATRSRLLLAGLLGGLCLLADYSGALPLGLLGLYAWWRRADASGWKGGFRDSLWYAAGAIGPVLALWWYQWASFGHPFYPPQHWMPPVDWIELGYQGVGGPQADLAALLLFEPRYGLLVALPMTFLLLGLPWLLWKRRSILPAREAIFSLALTVALIVFFSAVHYTRLQWVHGFRYLMPIVPFVFLAAVAVMARWPRAAVAAVAVVSVVISWSMAMVRSQGAIAENVVRVFVEGFQLPWLTVVSKMSAQYLPWLEGRPSAIPFLGLAGAIVAAIWTLREPWRRVR